MRNLTDAFKQEVNAQETSEVFITLATISHHSFTDDIRIAGDAMEYLPIAGIRGVVSRGEEYLFVPFDVILPSQDDSGVSRAQLVVDNTDRRIVEAIRKADSAVSVTLEIVRASAPDVPEITVLNFKLEKVNYNSQDVSGDISVEYYDTEPFPYGRFLPSGWPGAF